MKIAIGIVVLVLVALSFIVDYKWKQWIAARKQERDHPPNPGSPDHHPEN